MMVATNKASPNTRFTFVKNTEVLRGNCVGFTQDGVRMVLKGVVFPNLFSAAVNRVRTSKLVSGIMGGVILMLYHVCIAPNTLGIHANVF